MAAGGARPGAGRPKGSRVTRTQELIAKHTKDGATPIEVLLDGMRYYYNLSKQFPDDIFMLENAKDGAKMVHSYRSAAKDYAIAAAPYIHPKLSSVDAKVTVSNQETALAELE